MDPVSLFVGPIAGGAVLYVIWKLVGRIIAAWERVTAKRMELEEKRIDQQVAFSTGIIKLADEVGDNTKATLSLAEETRMNGRLIKRLIKQQTPRDGSVRVARGG